MLGLFNFEYSLTHLDVTHLNRGIYRGPLSISAYFDDFGIRIYTCSKSTHLAFERQLYIGRRLKQRFLHSLGHL
jgi:hypothetical protein